MKSYVGTKIIKAEPMREYTFISEERHYSTVLPAINREGYVVHYPDGYISWSPKDTFEIAYREITNEEKELIS